MPWEKNFDGHQASFGPIPWVAVLSFTEDELILSKMQAQKLNFDSPTKYGTVATTAQALKMAGTTVRSPLLSKGFTDEDYNASDPVDALLPQKSRFFDIFSAVDTNEEMTNNGGVHLDQFALLAHVRETSRDSVKGWRYSIVISKREGPPNIKTPTRMVSHLISLDGVFKTTFESQKFVALVSLHAWDWMCVPDQYGDMTDVFQKLGRNLKPLRISDQRLDTLITNSSKISSHWLFRHLKEGYSPKPHTLRKGVKVQSLLRNPFVPVKPSSHGVKPWSIAGEGLTLTDGETGIIDVTYRSAWELGKAMAMAD